MVIESRMKNIKMKKGMIDPCLLFDDNGKTWEA
jgi:beta-xylosidase